MRARALAVLAMLTLAGCTAGPDPLPVDELLAPDDGAATQARFDELVAQCMADAGFTYQPAPLTELVQDVDPGIVTTREFITTYGYGVTTSPEVLTPAADPDAPEPVAVPEHSELYLRALAGDPVIEGVDREDTGCLGYAQAALYPEDPQTFDDLWADLADMEAGTWGDPRLIEAGEQWAACLADAGYVVDPVIPGRAGPSAVALVTTRAAQVRAAVYDAADPAAPGFDPAVVQQDAADAVAALAEWEIAVATADLACRERLDIPDLIDTVAREHQEAFLDAHRAAVDEYRSAR